MERIITEHKEDILNFGAFGYSADVISKILEIPLKDVQKALKDESTELGRLYEKGKLMSEYAIDKKLFELAQKGDLKAIDKLEYRQRARVRDKK